MSKKYRCRVCGQEHRLNSPMGLEHQGLKTGYDDRDRRGGRFRARPKKDERRAGE